MAKPLQDSQYVRTGHRADSAGVPQRSLGRGTGYGQLGNGNGNGKTRERENIESWISSNLPGESYYAVSTARFRLKKQSQPVTAESVRAELKERGWLKEQRS